MLAALMERCGSIEGFLTKIWFAGLSAHVEVTSSVDLHPLMIKWVK